MDILIRKEMGLNIKKHIVFFILQNEISLFKEKPRRKSVINFILSYICHPFWTNYNQLT